MPIDDAEIDAKILRITEKLRKLGDEKKKLIEVHEMLQSIKKTNDGELPYDKGTMAQMSPTRRQSIYDKYIGEATRLTA